jgi:hypothetical protein
MFFMAVRKNLILRSLRSGRLEGRTEPIQRPRDAHAHPQVGEMRDGHSRA